MIAHYGNYSLTNIVEEFEGVVYHEEWRPIQGYEGKYEISNFGRIKSLNRKDERGKSHPTIILKSFFSHEYRRVQLSKNGDRIKYQVHRLVGEAFIPNPMNLSQINHKRGNRHDNRAWMLEWSTCADNHKHAFSYLGKKANTPWQGKSGDMHFRSHPVLKVSLDGFLIEVYGSKSEAGNAYSVTSHTIINYINKKSPYKGHYLM